MNNNTCDFLIIGGGVIGFSIALSLRQHFPTDSIIIIDKEAKCGIHASGRNSGVLHAGFYYHADSLKARFTVAGNKAMTEYCREKNVPVNDCGKVVVVQNHDELQALDILIERGKQNGVEIEEISVSDLKVMDPSIKTIERALFSPSTKSVDPRLVMNALEADAIKKKITIHYQTQYLSSAETTVQTNKTSYHAGYVINAAGLYADKIAKDFGFAREYRIVPFKGLYLTAKNNDFHLSTNVYPVPDLKNPFLGVHFTLDAHGKIKIGPTAIPALWRENYHGLDNFSFRENLEIIKTIGSLSLRNENNFMNLAFQELKKYNKVYLIQLASRLLNQTLNPDHWEWMTAGIRAQLYHTGQKKLEMDFCYEGDHQSFHVLNAVSPAFTCSIPFSEYLVNIIIKNISR